MSDGKKTYVLDTNVLLSDPDAIYWFAENHVVLPLIVVEEIDRHKKRQDEVGKNARQTSRNLDALREEASGLGKSLYEGMDLPPGTFQVKGVDEMTFAAMPFELRNSSVADNVIIATAYCLKNEGADVVLVSNDQNVRIKCDSIGIKSEQYLRQRVTDNIDELYRGVRRMSVTEADAESLNSFYANGGMKVTHAYVAANNIQPNEFLVYKLDAETPAMVGRYHEDAGMIKPLMNIKEAFGLTPKNTEQRFALDLLFDDRIKLVTLVGPSGTGKTLLATAAGLQQVMGATEPKYQRLIITRPVQPVGKDIGFLPGTKEEKMEPWIAPIRDNLSFLFGQGKSRGKRRSKADTNDNSYLSLLMDEGKIEVEAITFIRGRSIPNSFIIIDEAQNLSMHELKTIITRVGDGTKIILTGDIDQIDNTHVDAYTNGLTCAVEKFKQFAIAGHVTMIKGERSELATLATKVL